MHSTSVQVGKTMILCKELIHYGRGIPHLDYDAPKGGGDLGSHKGKKSSVRA
jgi:hypothetical protein